MAKKGGTWRTLKVPDWRLGGQGHPWCNRWSCLTLRKIPWKFRVDIFIISVSRMGVKKGGTWRTLRGPDRRFGGQGHPWCHRWSCLTLRKILWKFRVDIFIRSVSRMGGQEGGYLEEVEGSWPENWRTGSSLMLWMIFFYPKEDTLKVWCWYLY